MQTLKRVRRGGFAVQPLTMAQVYQRAQLVRVVSSVWLASARQGGCHAPFIAQSAAELREQPAFSMMGSAKLWGNVNVVACCANESIICG